MTARADYWTAADLAARALPDDWTADRGEYGYHARHRGVAMNPMQWVKPGIWTIDTVERTGECRIRFYRPTATQPDKQTPILIVGETLTVEKGPWQVTPQDGETLLTAGVRWVQQQENAARQLGSK